MQGWKETGWPVLSPNHCTTGRPCAWQVAPPAPGTERGQGAALANSCGQATCATQARAGKGDQNLIWNVLDLKHL